MIGDRIRDFVENKLLSEKNVERLVKYYWLVSTFRLALGASIAILILLFGYSFGDLVRWIDALGGG
ncbi:MAG: hypothetical protein ABWW66_03225 [Archaeoglobaceae archaeon]